MTPGERTDGPRRTRPTASGPAGARAGAGRGGRGGEPARPTIFSVAERAGVSKSLVSLVMRGSPKVSEARRKLVLEAAEELGYRPNLMASGLAARRTLTLGVLISDLHNFFFADVVDGVQEEAHRNGLRLLLATGRLDSGEEGDAVDAFVQLRVDGMVLLSPVLGDEALARAAAAVPTVVVARYGKPPPRSDVIINDERQGTALAVDHLVGLGHRRIAHIDGGDGASALERRRGYEAAMGAHGLETAVAAGAYTHEGGYRAMGEILDGGEHPTAVFAANDLTAIGALTLLEERGLRVPDDMSLVGYDDTYLASIPHIGLTSVSQPRVEMGRMAVEAFERRFDRPDRRAGVQTVASTLAVRSSTAPPRRRVRAF